MKQAVTPLPTIAMLLVCLNGLHAQSFPTTIHGFGRVNALGPIVNGNEPKSTLVETAPGVFYGTASAAGKLDCGTLFKITSAGAFTRLSDFGSGTSCFPGGALVQAGDGMLYGTTTGYFFGVGASSFFRSDLSGNLTGLVGFDTASDGKQFQAPTLAADGSVYSIVTTFGEGFGLSVFPYASVVFHYALDGTAEQIGTPFPVSTIPTALTLASDGNLYGMYLIMNGAVTTQVVFKVTSTGIQPIFSTPDTVEYDYPVAISQAGDGKLYFVTQETLASVTLGGRGYKMLGSLPDSYCQSFQTGFLLASDGSLYGGCGSVSPSANGVIYDVNNDSFGEFFTAVFGGADVLTSQSAVATEGMDGNFYGEVTQLASPNSPAFQGALFSSDGACGAHAGRYSVDAVHRSARHNSYDLRRPSAWRNCRFIWRRSRGISSNRGQSCYRVRSRRSIDWKRFGQHP